ncbi:hypothetical protein SUGI_0092550 [Cryptomeria japonica]|nr:hypothetical protein SUGI_0092550 [Cryptomeria japonica]
MRARAKARGCARVSGETDGGDEEAEDDDDEFGCVPCLCIGVWCVWNGDDLIDFNEEGVDGLLFADVLFFLDVMVIFLGTWLKALRLGVNWLLSMPFTFILLLGLVAFCGLSCLLFSLVYVIEVALSSPREEMDGVGDNLSPI